MHGGAYQFVVGCVPVLPSDGLVVELGARNVNGTIRGLFLGREYLGVDPSPGLSVDVVASGETFQPPHPAAVVLCCETLEHAACAEAICRNAYRILAPGGVFVVTAAGKGRDPHSAVDGGPLRDGEFYSNVEAETLSDWLSDFAEAAIQTRPELGDIYAMARKAAA